MYMTDVYPSVSGAGAGAFSSLSAIRLSFEPSSATNCCCFSGILFWDNGKTDKSKYNS